MTTYYEDTAGTLVAEEHVLEKGFSQDTHLDKLIQRLKRAVLGEKVPHAQVRAIVDIALAREPGIVFKSLFDLGDVTFRSKRRLSDVDEDLKPYYGHVNPALRELYGLGLEKAVGEFWIDLFLRDHKVYRVNVVACMCLAGAVLAQRESPNIGNPTRKAKTYKIAEDAEDTEQTVKNLSVLFQDAGTLDVGYEVT